MRRTTIHEEMLPSSTKDALRRWDAGESIFTVEMGGLGPGYEQCIHILIFELLRDALASDIPMPKIGQRLSDWGDTTVDRLDKRLGFSGAQVGAAKSLAGTMLAKGYAAAVNTVERKRHIQVSKHFPP